jgi:hypothetical protein
MQAILIGIMTQWFDAGTLEYVCRWHRVPQCILACGAADKSTEPFVCLITDGRPIIVYAQAWRVKYVTVSDLCLVLTPNALMAVRNLKAVYHLVRYAGCRGNTRYLVRWVTNHDRTGYVARRTMQSGCGPGDCLGFCDKSFFGISVGGHVGRFAAAQCGHKEVDSWTFVDNFMHSCPILWHEFCAGLAQGCPICLAALEKLL